jgi:hypothetical protein
MDWKWHGNVGLCGGDGGSARVEVLWPWRSAAAWAHGGWVILIWDLVCDFVNCRLDWWWVRKQTTLLLEHGGAHGFGCEGHGGLNGCECEAMVK